MKIWAFIVFLIIVLSTYTLVNLYIYNRGKQTLSSPTYKFIYKMLFIAVASSYVIGRVLEKIWLSAVSDVFTYIGAFWLAAMLYFFLILIAIDLIRILNYFFKIYPSFITDNLPRVKMLLFTFTISAVLIILVLGHINALNPDIKTINLKVNKPGGKYSSLNVVMISDVHLGTVIGKKRLAKLVSRINMLNPDIVLIAGDMLDEDIRPVIRQNLGRLLKEISSKNGIYAVAGNHEFIGGVQEACIYLEQNGIKMVRDTALLIDGSFYIVGRDDQAAGRFTGKSRKPLSEILAHVDRSLPMIMLDHTPFNLDDARQNNIDLQLSGHTHHGQLFPFNFITRKVYELSWGYLKKDNTHYYVSSGFGGWGPPVRVGNSPEIVNVKIEFNSVINTVKK